MGFYHDERETHWYDKVCRLTLFHDPLNHT